MFWALPKSGYYQAYSLWQRRNVKNTSFSNGFCEQCRGQSLTHTQNKGKGKSILYDSLKIFFDTQNERKKQALRSLRR
jgi:hypothetical protein